MNKLVKAFTEEMPKYLVFILLLTLATWAWVGFKKIEPVIWPVVEPIKIDVVEYVDGAVRIRGKLDKVRDCEFKQLVAYSNDFLLHTRFTETAEPVNRVPGVQYFGWWVFTPPVDVITIYSRHECSTGTVVTKIYEGALDVR